MRFFTKITFCFCLLKGFCSFLYGQNVYFSQYHLTPALTNPAIVASQNETHALLGFRQQRVGAGESFTTPTLSFGTPFFNKQERRRTGGFGVALLNESSGANNSFRTTALLAHLAYNLPLSETHFLSFGLQGGYYIRGIDASKVTTETLFLNGFDVNDLGEEVGVFNDAFPVVNSGLLFYKENENGQKAYQLGLALYALNRPSMSFYQEIAPVPIALQLTGEWLAYQEMYWQLHPTFRFIQRGNQQDWQAGLMARYLFPPQNRPGSILKEGAMGLGIWYRPSGVAVAALQIEQPDYILNISYDLGLSNQLPLRESSNALELTIGWRKLWDTGRRKKKNNRNLPDRNPPDKEPLITGNDEGEELLQRGSKNRTEKSNGTTVLVREPIIVTGQQMAYKMAASEKELFRKNIAFEAKSSLLTPEAEERLSEMIAVLLKYPEVLLKITATYLPEESPVLAKARQQAIKDYLIRFGIEEERLIDDHPPRQKNIAEASFTLMR
jgi:type IX secretion system PorP/SprF family membrane protein